MNIIQASRDKNLFQPFLGILITWDNWMALLCCLYGLAIKKKKYLRLLKEITGRTIFPTGGFRTALLLVGRRGGKSKIAALCAAFEACLSGKEKKLSPGEMGLVSVVSPSRFQSQIIKNYIRAIFKTDLLEAEIIKEGRDYFELSNGVRIQILTGDFRTVRGFTQLAVVVDEVCFIGYSEESKVKNDSELIQAIRPALLTTRGKLICISTKYAKRGWAYRTWKANFGNDKGKILVVDAPSRKMNPTLSEEDIAEAIAEDPVAGRTEFMNEWREDVGAYLPREVIESVVAKGLKERMPREDIHYFGFSDVSGGRNDPAALGIGHKEDRKVILDFVQQYKPPHSPYEVIRLMADELRQFNIRKVTGDNYSAEFVAQAFQSNGISYQKSELAKSGLYLELLPRICSGEIELLDDEVLINQLSLLERRTRSGGKDIIDHPSGGHDDVANVVAGVSTIAGKATIRAGAIRVRATRRRLFR